MVFWEQVEPSESKLWILVSTVAIRRSGCSLTKPPQQNGPGEPYAMFDMRNKYLRLNYSNNSKKTAKARLMCIVYAHLLSEVPGCIRLTDFTVKQTAKAESLCSTTPRIR